MTNPDLLERNINASFAIMDTDADGFLTSGDLNAHGARICEQLHITGSAADAILDGFLAWWEQLRADCDADGDGRISRAEFTQAMLSGGGDPQAYFSQQVGRTVSLVADAMDTDGDGFIELAEYQALFRSAPDFDPQIVQAAFERLDADGDGRISREELQAGIAHLFLSGDQAHPGTTMLGQA